MANRVFANSREIACKAAAGKTSAAFPDTCFTPPENPATPPGVPVPYPNTAFASDTTEGSKTIQISGQEVMLKNKSYFKKSSGDDAGKTAKKGLITSVIDGKVYFNAWSMDVKIEGENVDRHLDLTTNNHASVPGNTPVWPYLDKQSVEDEIGPCAKAIKKEKTACKDYQPHGRKDPCTKTSLGIEDKPSGEITSSEAVKLADKTAANECLAARRCALQPYNSPKSHCCPQQTGHHLIEASALHDIGRGGPGSIPVAGVGIPKKYSEDMAPCVCAEGVNQNTGTHGLMHAYQSASASSCRIGDIPLSSNTVLKGEKKTTYGTAKRKAIEAMQKTFPNSKCDPNCIEAQLDAYHSQCGINDKTTIKAVETGGIRESIADAAVKARTQRLRSGR